MELSKQLFGIDYDSACFGWESKQNDRGVIYYVNDTLQATSWNHPYLTKVLRDLETCYGDIKYAAYRTSLKLRDLQARIGLYGINLAALQQVCGASYVEDNSDSMSCSEALAFIQSVLQVPYGQELDELEIMTAADLILNLMMNLYDVNRRGKLYQRSIMNALTAMSRVRLHEKYKCFFASIKDENLTISRDKLLDFLNDLMQLTDLLKEGEAFGRNITAAVMSCFELTGNIQRDRIRENDFYSWLTREPQTVVWLPTLHRILATETVQHAVTCQVCNMMPVTGLRYRCLQCLKYDLCHGCFLRGRTSATHRLKHPMKEYCLPTSVSDNAKAFFLIMKNKLSRKHRGQTKAPYLPVDNSKNGSELDWQPRNHLSCLESSNSQSTDSGLAVGSDNGDEPRTDEPISPQEEEESFTRQCCKPVEILGRPCNTSSPLVADAEEERTYLSKKDIENKQKQMARKIKQLQKENKRLQKKLREFQRALDGELLASASDTDFEEPTDVLLNEDPLKEITTDSPISPIVRRDGISAECALECDTICTQSKDKEEPDPLDIVGMCTPIPLARSERGETSSKGIHVHQDTKEGCSFGESSEENGLEYKSSDMSIFLSSTEEESVAQNCKTDVTDKTVNSCPSVMPDGLLSQSNISFDIQTRFCKSGFNDSDASVDGNTLTFDDQRLVNCSISNLSSSDRKVYSETDASTFLSGVGRKQCPSLIFTSLSLKSKSVPTDKEGRQPGVKPVLQDGIMNGNPFIENVEIHEANGSMELSDILPDTKSVSQPGSSSYFLHLNGSTPPKLRTVPKCKTLVPVHMSTPVTSTKVPKSLFTQKTHFVCSKYSDTVGADKENNAAVNSKALSLQTLAGDFGNNMTPLPCIPPKQRKRILMSINSLPSSPGASYDNMTTGQNSLLGLSVMFQKAEHIGKMISEASVSLLTHEKSQLEKLMLDFKRECAFPDSKDSADETAQGQAVDDYSILEAVLNIGNAMTDFVKATAQSQQ